MKCDKCGNESKYAVKILSEEQDITNTRTTKRGTEQTPIPPTMDVKWCLSCIRQAALQIEIIYTTNMFSPNVVFKTTIFLGMVEEIKDNIIMLMKADKK